MTHNEPERGLLRCTAGGREIYVRYPDARHTLYIEILMLRDGFDHLAMDTFLDFVKTLQAGKPPMVFGYMPLVKDGAELQITTTSRAYPKVYQALQFLVRNFFRVPDVFAVRLARGVQTTSYCSLSQKSTLIYFTSDTDPQFQCYESKDSALNIAEITGGQRHRIMQCLTYLLNVPPWRQQRAVVGTTTPTRGAVCSPIA